MIEWKDDNQLNSHYEKHVLDPNENKLWEKIPVKLIPEYKGISIYNTKGDAFLYKPKDTDYFSINYYGDYSGSTMITSTRKNIDEYKIYSCYLTKEFVKKYINIYLFVNGIEYYHGINLINFRKYENDDKIYDKYLSRAINYSKLDCPKYTYQEKESLLKMNVLIEFLKDNDKLKNGDDLLIHKQLKEKLLSVIKNSTFTISPNLYKVKKQICDMYNDKKIYEEYKDSVDLLIEIINFINDKKEINNKENMWTEMFENFRNLDLNK